MKTNKTKVRLENRSEIIRFMINYKKNTPIKFKSRYVLREPNESDGWIHHHILSSTLKLENHHKLYTIEDTELKDIIEAKKANRYITKNNTPSTPLQYRLIREKGPFLKLFVWFYENDELRSFIESDYFNDNTIIVQSTVSDYKSLVEDVLGKLKEFKDKAFPDKVLKLIREVYNDYCEPPQFKGCILGFENVHLFYYFAKDRIKFERTIRAFTNEFNKHRIDNEHIKKLLSLSMAIQYKFNDLFNDKNKDITKFDDILKDYEELFRFNLLPYAKKVGWYSQIKQKDGGLRKNQQKLV